MTLTIEIERESDGRWIAEVPTLPGTMCYGQTRDEAIAHVQALALRGRIVRVQRGTHASGASRGSLDKPQKDKSE
jgi:hypothetical protein